MKKLLLAGVLTMAISSIDASATITVKLPANSGLDSISYFHAPIQKLATAKSRAERGIVEGKVPVVNNAATITLNPADGASRVGINFSENDYINFYSNPEEEIVAEVTSLSPFDYNLSGSPFIDGMNEVEALSKPLIEKWLQASLNRRI